MATVFRDLLALIILSAGTIVCSVLGPPCMSPLGLQLDLNSYSLTFELAASSGEANNIRMNGPKSWRPVDVDGSFLEINISQPVLLTGLQVQGDPQETGQINGWLLDTSQDCETYQTEIYFLDDDSPIHTQTVHLKSVQFVTCIRLRPTQFKGKSADLRMELLGCVIEDNSVCDRDVHPVTEVWLESGGRQLNFLHEIVISWVKILLDLQALGDTGDAGVFYSRSCDDQWNYYEPSDSRVIAVTSPDQTSSWMTIDMEKPVRAKCLRIFPPFSTTLKEVHTSGCSAHVTTSLHEIRRNNNTNIYETDIAAYQEDAPYVVGNEKMHRDNEHGKLTQGEEKSVLSETSRTNVKSSQKQQDDEKATATTIVVTEDSTDRHVTRTVEETSAKAAGAVPEPTEEILALSHDAKENISIEGSLPEPTKKSVDIQLTTVTNKDSLPESTQNTTPGLYNSEIRRDKQNSTQSTEVSYNITALYYQQSEVINKSISNMSDAYIVADDQKTSANISEEISIINNDVNPRSTTLPLEVTTNEGSILGELDTSADTHSDTTATVQHTVGTSTIPSIEEEMAVTREFVNDSPITKSKDSSTAYTENSNSTVNSKNQSSIIHSEEGNSRVHYKDVSSIIHSQDSRSVVHFEDSSSNVHSEDSISTSDYEEGDTSDFEPWETDSSNQPERNNLDSYEWWRSDCGVKHGAKGYRKKRVVSGRRNRPGEWPWLVSMHFLPQINFTSESGYKHLCGGSLIAPGWVLTAAHCFSDMYKSGLSNVSNWRVYFGLNDLAREDNQDFVQERLMEDLFIYPRYLDSDPLIYDMALIKLNESVDYSDRVSPVCLDDTDIHYGEIPCYISGWGQLTDNPPGSRFPHTASVSTMSPAMCKSKYDLLPEEHVMKPYIRMTPPVLCARVGSSGEDACQGDSGGPLMCQHDGRWYQAGVVAAGYLCGHEATPGLYSRVSYYVDWIRETIADNGGP